MTTSAHASRCRPSMITTSASERMSEPARAYSDAASTWSTTPSGTSLTSAPGTRRMTPSAHSRSCSIETTHAPLRWSQTVEAPEPYSSTIELGCTTPSSHLVAGKGSHGLQSSSSIARPQPSASRSLRRIKRRRRSRGFRAQPAVVATRLQASAATRRTPMREFAFRSMATMMSPNQSPNRFPRSVIRAMRYVQYGCGFSAPEGWINFDASPTLRFERVVGVGRLYTRNRSRFPPTVRFGDVVRGLPIEDDSCDGVYASHVLEHLSLDDCRLALAETFRILAPGGTFRLVVPDLQAYASRYLEASRRGESCAAHRFMDETSLGQRSRSRAPMAMLSMLIGNAAHRWMWDEASLTAALTEVGFRETRRDSDRRQWRPHVRPCGGGVEVCRRVRG